MVYNTVWVHAMLCRNLNYNTLAQSPHLVQNAEECTLGPRGWEPHLQNRKEPRGPCPCCHVIRSKRHPGCNARHHHHHPPNSALPIAVQPAIFCTCVTYKHKLPPPPLRPATFEPRPLCLQHAHCTTSLHLHPPASCGVCRRRLSPPPQRQALVDSSSLFAEVRCGGTLLR